MKRLNERELSPVFSERMLLPVRAVMARMTDVLWQADGAGGITSITLCRPSLPSGEGELDPAEIQRVEQLWGRCVRHPERFNAAYHVRSRDRSPRPFVVQAMPVLDARDEVLYWSGSATEHAENSDRERRLLQTLQQAILPARMATVEGASLSAVYRPAASEVQLGGDWYDAFDLDEHRVLLTVGDVTGHGLEASVVMGKLRHSINVAAMYEPDPVRILDAAERILLRRYPGSIATAFVAIYDPRDRSITCANAGHPHPILRGTDGSLRELEAGGLPIGLRSFGRPMRPIVESLDNAALLAFYTDGLTEATRDLKAGERLLREALSTEAIFCAGNPAEFVHNYCLRTQSPDDVAILVLNFVDSPRRFGPSPLSKSHRTRGTVVMQTAQGVNA